MRRIYTIRKDVAVGVDDAEGAGTQTPYTYSGCLNSIGKIFISVKGCSGCWRLFRRIYTTWKHVFVAVNDEGGAGVQAA